MRTSGVEKNNRRFVRKFQLRRFQATLFEGVNIIAFSEEIKSTDKDDIRSWQQVEILPFLQSIYVQHSLIIACTLRQHMLACFRISCVLHLHFQIVMRVLFVSDDNIKTYTTAVIKNINSLFDFRIRNFCNRCLQHFFKQVLTDTRITHNLFEKKIMTNSQVIKFWR